jgi:hypothetical protein
VDYRSAGIGSRLHSVSRHRASEAIQPFATVMDSITRFITQKLRNFRSCGRATALFASLQCGVSGKHHVAVVRH